MHFRRSSRCVTHAPWRSGGLATSAAAKDASLIKCIHAASRSAQVTLLFLASAQISAEQADLRGFHHVHVASKDMTDDEALALVEWAREQAFHAVFYPQTGMHFSDLLLANSRVAPLQVSPVILQPTHDRVRSLCAWGGG